MSVVKGLRVLSILSEEEYDELYQQEAADFFTAKMGADAVLSAIDKINLEEISKELREEIGAIKGGSSKYVKLVKRLKLVDGLRRAKINPSWMILRVLPVLPPDLRPMVQLSGGRFATSDLNDLYRRVINRNNRLKHLISLGSPRNNSEERKKNASGSSGLFNRCISKKSNQKIPRQTALKSLSDMLRGKQGRFRQNFLENVSIIRVGALLLSDPNLNLPSADFPKTWLLKCLSPLFLGK